MGQGTRTHRIPSYRLVVTHSGRIILRAEKIGSTMGAMRLACVALDGAQSPPPGNEWLIEVKITDEGFSEVETGSP